MREPPLHLFEAIGIEIEYMIVDRDSLAVRPIADELLKAAAGSYETEIERDGIAWSNELALHVIELKTNGPVKSLSGIAELFQANVRDANRLLAPMNARLMPSAMHPWMDPRTEVRLWPHEYNPIYETFDRIFDCRGHGWANLQSVHMNLPFAGDEELARLHAAIRFLLPVMPALAASSPVVDGGLSGRLDTRLEVYRTNTARIPSVTGAVIPEAVSSRAEYEEKILAPIYRDLAPYDPEGTLRDEWVNARGCIARFDRMALEIRLLDVQECPAADLAMAEAIRRVLQAIVEGRLGCLERMSAFSTDHLARLLLDVIRDADGTLISAEYAAALGFGRPGEVRAIELWAHLLESVGPAGAESDAVLETILEHGCLARRLVRRLGGDARRETLSRVFAELCDCLADGRMFL